MTRRRPAVAAAAVTAGLTATAGLALLTPSAPATADDTPGYSVRHVTVDTRVGPNRDQPCTVTADLYTPDGASRRHRVTLVAPIARPP